MSRLLQYLLLLTILVGLSGAALADVTPDVEVHLVSPFVAVKAGDTYEGQLEIFSGEDGKVSEFAMTSEGWTTSLGTTLGSTDMKAGDRLTIDFTARAVNPHEKIQFTFDYKGHKIPFDIDLSEENVRNMTEGASVMEVSSFVAPAGDPSWEETDYILGIKPTIINDPALRTITVSGRFGCTMEGGGYLPAHSIRIEIWDQDSGADDLMGVGSTNYDGYFSIQVDSNDGDSGSDPDIYVKYLLENGRMRVYEPSSGNNYSYVTGVTTNYSGSNLDVGSLIPSNPDLQASVFMHTNGSRAWVHDSNLGYDVPAARIEWPSAAWPNCSPSGRIQMREDFSWRDGTVWHEYGHWFDHEMASWEPFNYCNGVCDSSPTNCGHCFWCEESEAIAWLEGWAQFHGFAVSSWAPGYYGYTPLSGITAENISQCGGSWDAALLTEGFVAALAQDIADNTQDSHGAFGSYTDALATGVGTIFSVNANDNPTGSQDFANKYVARYPGHRENFWETAANCGFWFDTTAPGVVSSLNSSSHSSGVPSPDPTVRFTWTRATDNYSGIQGYGLSITTSGGARPSAVMDIGDVTSYTTDSLAPGTYYFNIRAVDNAGYWSTSYRTWGPIVIREPDPADLTNYLPTGWDYPLVPRTTNDSGGTYAPVPGTLPGDATATYWNIYGVNQGEAGTGSNFTNYLNIDGEYVAGATWGAIGAGGLYWGPNRGPVYVQAGRHSFTLRHDATDQVAEENENNNVTGHQFIWTTPTVDNDQLTSRANPPALTGGWDQVTSGILYYNCDGVTMPTASNWWHAMAVWSDSDAVDLDCRLHATSTGSQDGFGNNLGHSSNSYGSMDAVIVNRNNVAGASWDVGVLAWAGTGSYKAYHASSRTMAFGDSITIPMVEDQPIMLREFYIGSDNLGHVSVTASGDPSDGPMRLVLMSRDYEQGTINSGAQVGTQWTNSSGLARVSSELLDVGWYGIAVYRNQSDGLAARDVTIEVSTTPPDLAPWTPAGWHAAITPRPADDGTSSSCPEPAMLNSAPGFTYFNVAATNAGPVSSTLPSRIYRDDVLQSWVNWGELSAGATVSFNWDNPFALSSGRHVLSYRVDALEQIEETIETNNVRGEQWIWAPEELAPPMSTFRAAPPVSTAGWGDITTGEILWYNCDGLRLVGVNGGFWKSMAVMPEDGSDFDIRLHEPSTSAKTGFGSSLVGSFEAGTKLEYVIVDQNVASAQNYDVGVLRWNGTGSYRAQSETASFNSGNPYNTWGPFAIPNNGLVSMQEFYMGVENYGIRLENLSNADLGIAVHMSSDVAYQNRTHAVAGADENGPGMDEIVSLDASLETYYCIVVYRNDQSTDPASFRLVINNELSPVDDVALPRVTRLTGAYPNPFNPQTTVAFDLAKADHARISIYDVQGRLVRRLVDETFAAGHHSAVWMGRDDKGQGVASGVYFARLEASSGNGITKLVLVK